MKPNTINTLTCLLLIALKGLACSHAVDGPRISQNKPTLSAARVLPITEVVQSINDSYESLWDETLRVLKKREIELSFTDIASGTIVSDWVIVNDKLCGAQKGISTPLLCKVRFHIQISKLTRRASTFTIRYEEQCLEHQDQPLECPGSMGEQFMLSIVDDLKLEYGLNK